MLRGNVIRAYGYRCVATGFNVAECDVAHIVPKSVSMILDLNKELFAYNCNNCLLLTKSAHHHFDNFNWTIDIFSAKKHNDNIVTCNIIKNQTLSRSKNIMNYAHPEVKISYETLPFLYLHYHVYLSQNYSINHSVIDVFSYHLNDENHFGNLIKIDNVDNMIKYFKSNQSGYRYIVGGSESGYKVLWDFAAFQDSTWLEEEEIIDKSGIEMYKEYVSIASDGDFKVKI
jgi:hypothetical protein